MIYLLLISFLIMLFLGMPVAYAMAVSSSLAIFLDPSLPSLVIGQKMFTAMDSFSLMAIPFFMLAGALMNETGITKKIVAFAQSIVGHLTGGLGHTAILTGILMAGISGSANADTSAIASMLVPALREEGYDDGYACALVSGCGALGPVIPPSIMMVVYSGVVSISISALFLAGVIPGLLIGGGYMIINYIYAKKNNIAKLKFGGIKTIFITLKGAIWALIMPVIIIGGILSGIVTATEARCSGSGLRRFIWFYFQKSGYGKVQKMPGGIGGINNKSHDDHGVCGAVRLCDYLLQFCEGNRRPDSFRDI